MSRFTHSVWVILYSLIPIYNKMKVFIPIIASLCVELNLNPLYLCIPVTFACSFAFM